MVPSAMLYKKTSVTSLSLTATTLEQIHQFALECDFTAGSPLYAVLRTSLYDDILKEVEV
jgi:hypothetical protein